MKRVTRIFYTYLRITQLLSQQMRLPVGDLSLTFHHALLLTVLERDGPMSIGALAHHSCIANSTLSGILHQLEEMGLVTRRRAEHDHRVFYVEVTDAYRRLQQEAAEEMDLHLERRLAPLDGAAQDEVLRALERLEQALRDTAPDDRA